MRLDIRILLGRKLISCLVGKGVISSLIQILLRTGRMILMCLDTLRRRAIELCKIVRPLMSSQRPDQEPSLLEMIETAPTSLDRASKWSFRAYFLMIKTSRIDHAGHANDPVHHLHDVVMYNDVLKFVREWIDKHPNTMMMSAADHECVVLHSMGPIHFP